MNLHTRRAPAGFGGGGGWARRLTVALRLGEFRAKLRHGLLQLFLLSAQLVDEGAVLVGCDFEAMVQLQAQ